MAEVLICGAGPTGLAAACFLTKLGVPVRIFDKNRSRSTHSKALGVQAGTLECLAHALGEAIPEALIARGHKTKEAFFHINEHEPVRVDLSKIPSRFPYILVTPQSETEAVLEDYLNARGVRVEREHELIGLDNLNTGVRATLRGPNGQNHQVEAAYILGADGAHSAVRRLTGLGFAGDSYPGNFILADVEIDWQWPAGTMQTFVNARGLTACFSMPGERRYRMIVIPKNLPEHDEGAEISWPEFQQVVATVNPTSLKLANPTWLTRFRLHHRMVEHFRTGRAFLAGDSAHIHSPVGGQGMNTGIQDAFNLSYKLKLVLCGLAPASLLDHYEAERKPVAKNVLHSTDFVFRMALLPENPWRDWLRGTVVPAIVSLGWVQKKVVTAVSEAEVAQREIARYDLVRLNVPSASSMAVSISES